MLGLFTSKKPDVREIIVPDTVIAAEAERYALVTAVIDYVNRMMNQGHFRRWEIPEEAMQVYHADYYYSQVTNGGHSQFIGNSGMEPYTFADAHAGLVAMDGGPFLDCFEEMCAWIEANPEEAKRQDGFEHRAKALEKLDEIFFASDRDKREDFYSYAKPWVRGLRCLRVVGQDQYDVAIDKLFAQNPLAAQRADDALAGSLHAKLTHRLQAGLQIAGRRADRPLQIIGLTAGSFIKVDGKDTIRWGVRTDDGLCFGMELDHGVVLVREIEEEVQTPSGPRKQRRDQTIGGATNEELDRAMAHAADHNVAMAAVTALREIGISTGPEWIAFYGSASNAQTKVDLAMYKIGLDEKAVTNLMVGENGAALTDPSNPEMVHRLTPEQIAAAQQAMTDRLDADKATLQSLSPPRQSKAGTRKTARKKTQRRDDAAQVRPEKADAKPGGKTSFWGGKQLDTVWLQNFMDDELAIIDQDIRDLHFRLEDPMDVGVSIALLGETPPAALLELGEPLENWDINNEFTDRVGIMTSIGSLSASEISTGISVHTVKAGPPRKTMLRATRREVIDAAIGAAHRYPVALGLFILLNQAGLLDQFIGVAHHQTGGAGLTEVLLKNPKIQEALGTKPGSRKKKKSPSEHFAVLFEGVSGVAIAHFGEERAVLMPYSGDTDDLFDTVPVMPMEDLLYEEQAFMARLKT